MKWHAQVAHVAAKDLRSAWLPIAAFVALVALATAIAAGWWAGGEGELWSLLVVVLGLVLVGLFVQADSPARSDAFWATRPLYPTAVFAAKLMLLVLVPLGIGLVGQLIGFVAHDVPARDLPALLWESATEWYVEWLVIAALVASLTRELRTFLLAFVLVFVAWMAGWGVLAAYVVGGGAVFDPPVYVAGAMTVAMIALVGYQYRSRDVRRGLGLALGLVVAGTAVAMATAGPAREAPGATGGGEGVEAAGAPTPAGLRARVRIDRVRIRETSAMPEVLMTFQIDGGSPAHRYVLLDPELRIRPPGGPAIHIPAERPSGGVLRQPEPDPGGGYTWRMTSGRGTAEPARAWFTLTDAAVGAMRRGAETIIEFRIGVDEPRVTVDLPLESRSLVVDDGVRLRVLDVALGEDGPEVEVGLSIVTPPADRFDHGPFGSWSGRWRVGDHEFALVNRRLQEALSLKPRSTSVSGLGSVIPSPAVSKQTQRLFPPSFSIVGPGAAADPRAAPVDRAWLADAQLRFVQWAPVGAYAMRVRGLRLVPRGS